VVATTNITKLLANIQKKWFEFCLKKLKSLKNKNVYEVVNFSKRQKVIKNYWVFNIKFDSHYRSWLIKKGLFQVEEINFDKLSSLVICYEIAYLFLAITALEDWNIHNVDIKTIYLYGNLDKKIYTEQSKGFKLSSK